MNDSRRFTIDDRMGNVLRVRLPRHIWLSTYHLLRFYFEMSINNYTTILFHEHMHNTGITRRCYEHVSIYNSLKVPFNTTLKVLTTYIIGVSHESKK